MGNKKKQGTVQPFTVADSNPTEGSTADVISKKMNAAAASGNATATGDNSVANAAQPAKPAVTPIYQRNADALRTRANSLREYSRTPVEIDTRGQRDYLQEFLDSPLAKRQETAEQRERREKRERTNRRIAALADGLIGLTNIVSSANGATAFQQTPYSTAHRQAVDDALKRREALREKYEVARKNAADLARKQDALNADRRDAERKLRREAAKQADDLEAKAGAMENEGAAGDRKFGLDQQKAKDDKDYKDKVLEEKKLHNRAMEGLRAQSNNISASKGGGRGSGGKDDNWIWDELADWEDAYSTELKAKLEQNGVTQYDRHNKTISKPVVRRIIAEMRNKYGSPTKPKKASVVTVKGKKQGNSNYKGRFN